MGGGYGPARSPGGFQERVDEVFASGGAGAFARGAGSELSAGAPGGEGRRAWGRAADGGLADRLDSRRRAQPLPGALEQAWILRTALAGRASCGGSALRVLVACGVLHPDRGLRSLPAA